MYIKEIWVKDVRLSAFYSLYLQWHRSPITGYVKYRYGTSDKVELEYPKSKPLY